MNAKLRSILALMPLVILLVGVACADRSGAGNNQPGSPATLTSGEPEQQRRANPPSARTPASPATAWTTSGGPATPGAPAAGTIVDADGGTY